MAKNVHRVPKKQWCNWSKNAQHVFNQLYSLMGEVGLFLHPKSPKPKREHWKTTKWNAAWCAAQATDHKW
jgi:hypothetical protein